MSKTVIGNITPRHECQLGYPNPDTFPTGTVVVCDECGAQYVAEPRDNVHGGYRYYVWRRLNWWERLHGRRSKQERAPS